MAKASLGVLRSVERSAQLLSRYLTAQLAGELTEVEAHVLFHLEHLHGVRPTMRELQRAFGLRASTLTAIVDRLESQNLVQRQPNPDDRRSTLVVPTAAAKKAIARVSQVLADIESSVRSRVTNAQMAGFAAVIQAIDDAIS